MPLDATKKQWLQKFSGVTAIKKEKDQEKGRKDALIASLVAELTPHKEAVQKTLMETRVKKKGLLGGSEKLLDIKGDQMSEFESQEAKDTLGLPPEKMSEVAGAFQKVVQSIEKMAKATKKVKRPVKDKQGKPVLDREGNPVEEEVDEPVFTEDEIRDEYAALVRERVIPENLIPKKYSKTQEMLDRTNALYMERLKKENEANTGTESLPKFAKTMVDKTSKLAKEAAKMAGAEGQLAANIIDLVALGTTTMIDLGEALSKADFESAGGTIIDNIGAILEKAIAMPLGPDAGKAASMAYKSGASLGKFAIALSSEPPDIDGAMGALADGFTAAFDTGVGLSKAGIDPKIANTVKTSVTAAFIGTAKAKKLVDAAREGDFVKIVDACNGAAQLALTKSAALAKDWDEKNTKKIAEIEGHLQQSMSMTTGALKTGKVVVDAAKKKDITVMANALLDGMGDVVGGVMKQAAPKIGDRVSGAYAAAVAPARIAAFLYADPPQVDRALETMGAGFEKALSSMMPSDPNFKQVGITFSVTFQNAAKAYNMKQALDAGKYDEVLSHFNKIAKLTAGQILKADLSKDPTATEGTEAQIVRDALKISGDKALGDFLKTFNDPTFEEKMLSNLAEAQAKSVLDEVEQARAEAQRALVLRDEGGKLAADNHSIEKLTKELLRNRLILELATKVSQAGIGVAAKFVPGLEIGGAAISLAANLLKAANLAMELHAWAQNHRDALKSQSVYSTSIQNFVKNQAELFSHTTIQAALDLVQLIGSICTVAGAGMASAAGQAMSKAAALAKAAEDVLFTAYKRADLEVAWVITKRAFADPENRKLGLLARRQNPTLAKYAIAFGAMVKRDAIAKSALTSCGINEMTLADPKANVEKVQNFLEMYFNEDNKVLKAPPVLPDWAPTEIKLTAACWTTAKARAVRVAFLLESDTRQVEVLLTRINKFDGNNALTDEEFSQVSKDLDELQSALSSYRPVHSPKAHKMIANKPHDTMKAVVDTFVSLAIDMEVTLHERSMMNISGLFEEE